MYVHTQYNRVIPCLQFTLGIRLAWLASAHNTDKHKLLWQAVCADEFSCLSQFSNICCYKKKISPPNIQDLTVKCSLFLSSLTDLLMLPQYRFGLSFSQASRTWAICQVEPNKITMELLSMYINICTQAYTKNMACYLLFHFAIGITHPNANVWNYEMLWSRKLNPIQTHPTVITTFK